MLFGVTRSSLNPMTGWISTLLPQHQIIHWGHSNREPYTARQSDTPVCYRGWKVNFLLSLVR
jgi:hypothetical protein